MKLLRFGEWGNEKPGLLDKNNKIRDLSSVIKDIEPGTLTPDSIKMLQGIAIEKLPLVDDVMRIGPPVASVGKLVCVGLNYKDHAKETGQPIPKEPVLFMKATSSICGPNDNVIIPKGSMKTDWEVEVGIVIGTRASYVAAHDAMKHVAGYCIVNDVSEREFQFDRGGNWSKGKSADSFCPLGPYLVTADEVTNPQELVLFCEVNRERMQDGNTADMIFNIPQLISYISHFMTLNPGDIIPTGTPAGVGFGCNPPTFLKPGDVMRLGVAGLGEQKQNVIAFTH